MNHEILTKVVHQVVEYYNRKNGYQTISGDQSICLGHPSTTILGVLPERPSQGWYYTSLIIDPAFFSTKLDSILSAQPVGIGGLYWAADNQGVHQARVVAHVGLWDQIPTEIYALVAKQDSKRDQ